MNESLIDLRKKLHKYPELSGEEHATAKRIVEFVKDYHPTDIIENIGGEGIAVIYEFGDDGPTVAIRCELDALPILEENTFSYQSKNKGVSHKCGHDGHMAIVAGLSEWLEEAEIKNGKVVLLFQPAEETGKGAAKMLGDIRFTNLAPDYVFALHNLPGQKMHSVLVKPGYFTATVQSLCIRLKGKKAHASEPENGVNPVLASAELIQLLATFANPDFESDDFALLTPICIDIGKKNYGISPESAEIHYTIRTWSGLLMSGLEDKIKDSVDVVAKKYQLSHNIDWFEFFPASENNAFCTELVEKVAAQKGFDLKKIHSPLRFGEDFGWFSQHYKSVIFGLGAGEQHPSLHHADYDFPDELIDTGIAMFKGLITEILVN
ncbi:amidohydrolase [uncultured Maribacter sp.]|uniref:amidohydrolase n=1 Tax=uncultured Maribacter sp. TaxID=431308 RepID=UPI0030DAEBF4|tara:strand:- start:982 stop:2115 length:1134 start_codon:yes stop_codon:yes gene_type:complete